MSVDFDKQKTGVAVITFNRPEKLNSVTQADREHLADLLGEVRSDPNQSRHHHGRGRACLHCRQ
ncbi:MAG TPA: hypothetical protein VGY99_05620 [Candidatus Binataceae bacterium]|jgi:enoyl-CoA hydratase/carnithine racemase|nr:hypothetical protein [Candidatus Binataceae bacterium]